MPFQNLLLDALVPQVVEVLAETLEGEGEHRQGVGVEKVELFFVKEVFEEAGDSFLGEPGREFAHEGEEVSEEVLE